MKLGGTINSHPQNSTVGARHVAVDTCCEVLLIGELRGADPKKEVFTSGVHTPKKMNLATTHRVDIVEPPQWPRGSSSKCRLLTSLDE